MSKHNPSNIINVRLAPGEFFFGGGLTRIHTLLGSCVSITLWHPSKHIGGMCHYLLGSRGTSQRAKQSHGHYAEDAMALFLQAIRDAHTRPQEYEVKLFGGGNMFESLGHKRATSTVSENNILAGKALLKQHGFSSIKAHDLGGAHHRKIYFELWNGDVWVQRGPSTRTGQL